MELAQKVVGKSDEIYLLDVLAPAARELAVERFATRIEATRKDVAASQLRVLLRRDDEYYVPLLRTFKDRSDLRDVVVTGLSRFPESQDRSLFVEALSSFNLTTVKQGTIGLRRLGGNAQPDELVTALSKTFQIAWDKPATSVRDQLVLLLQERTKQSFGYAMKKPGFNQTESLTRWKMYLSKEYPKAFESTFRDSNSSKQLSERLRTINWSAGDANRGAKVFKSRQCAQCHDMGSRLGPRLEGIASRFARDDIFRSIVLPNEQVPDRYRAVMIETVDGQVIQGSVVYQSVEGVTLQESSGNTVRINRGDIESRSVSKNSLMPEGLLNDASGQDWADLYAYLKKL
jgi:putative heme-binding domain-containing protein